MGNTNIGDQIITFRYQQEGTAQGFNKLLQGVVPTGIISGGELSKVVNENNQVLISPMQMMISDGNVIVHVQTREPITLPVQSANPYIVAKFDWAQLVDNYVTFECVNYSSLNSKNLIILGKCEFNSNSQTLSGKFDLTRRTWSSTYLNNDFLFSYANNQPSLPSFRVSSIEPMGSTVGFTINRGEAVINGKRAYLNDSTNCILDGNDTSSNKYINRTVNNGRIDILVLLSAQGNEYDVKYIMGEDNQNPVPPIYPPQGLVLAEITHSSGNIAYINGSSIRNVYNNNYYSASPSMVGIQRGGTKTNSHTLYI